MPLACASPGLGRRPVTPGRIRAGSADSVGTGGHFGGRSPINSYRESLTVVPLVPFLSQLCERSENGEPRSSQTLETTVTKVRDH